jgi:hypothetical protein
VATITEALRELHKSHGRYHCRLYIPECPRNCSGQIFDSAGFIPQLGLVLERRTRTDKERLVRLGKATDGEPDSAAATRSRNGHSYYTIR